MTHNIIKAAQWDMSDIGDKIRSMGRGLGNAASTAGSKLSDFARNMSPETKQQLLRAALGAGAGASALGLTYAMSDRDPDEPNRWKSKALLGALLGGGAAVAIPQGLKMMSPAGRFKGESEQGPISNATDAVGRAAVSNIGAVGAGGWMLHKQIKNNGGLIGSDMGGPTAAKLQQIWNSAEQPVRDGVRGIRPNLGDPISRAEMTLDDLRLSSAEAPDFKNMKAPERRRMFNDFGKNYGGSKIPDGVIEHNYGDLTKSHTLNVPKAKIQSALGRVPYLGDLSRRIPETVKFRTLARQGMTNFKDPRVKMLAAVLAAAGGGYVAQKGIEGAL